MIKKILMPLCVISLIATSLTACGQPKTDASSSDVGSATLSASSPASSSAASLPTASTDIMWHNDLIEPDDVQLIQFASPAADAKYATIKTELGDIRMLLFPTEAPNAVENFTALAGDGFYNGMRINEVIPNVRIGAGATDSDGLIGKSASGAAFDDEYSLKLWHFNGAVAMNNGSIPGANDSRFYIVQNTAVPEETLHAAIDGAFPQKVIDQYIAVGGVPNYDFRDTVFAQVVEGLDVLEKIALVELDSQHQPKTDVKILSITLS